MSRITQIIETLEAEKADLQRRLAWVDGQLAQFREHADAEQIVATVVPRRATRRQTSRRASARRKTARERKRDLAAEIIAYLDEHPSSTAGDVAKAIDANRGTVATKLTQMAKAGRIVKADRGYAPSPGA